MVTGIGPLLSGITSGVNDTGGLLRPAVLCISRGNGPGALDAVNNHLNAHFMNANTAALCTAS